MVVMGTVMMAMASLVETPFLIKGFPTNKEVECMQSKGPDDLECLK
jgi:hypothetical protein